MLKKKLFTYNSKNSLYIISAISAIEKIIIYSNEFVSADDLLNSNNQMNFNGTITLLIAIAEETKKIDIKLLETQQQIQLVSGKLLILNS